MQSDMKGKVVMKLEGVMAEAILKIDPKQYTKYVVNENGKDVIYVILAKALYGTLQAALLFWQNLSAQLEKWGFKINPYDFCVANKTINGKQCTIVWHVDDLKVSHTDPKVVTAMLESLDARYGQEIVGGKRAPLTINQGQVHDYLGMTLDYSETNFVKIDMTKHVRKILDKMPKNMNGTATLPAADHLFQIVDGVELLDTATSDFFHATVAKLLFLCKRGRPDIQTAIASTTFYLKRYGLNTLWRRKVMAYPRSSTRTSKAQSSCLKTARPPVEKALGTSIFVTSSSPTKSPARKWPSSIVRPKKW
jgi:hypothetical protein